MITITSPAQKLFGCTRKVSIILAIASLIAGIGAALVMSATDLSLRDKNSNDIEKFDVARRTLDEADKSLASKFTVHSKETVDTRMAQRGHLALLDVNQTQQVFGYKELERIAVTKTVDGLTENVQKHVFPNISLTGFVFSPEGNSCTTLVRYSVNGNNSQSMMWKWERKNESEEWKTDSLPNNYSAKDVEISREGISFTLESKETLTSSPVYVLRNGLTGGGNNGTKRIDIKVVPQR